MEGQRLNRVKINCNYICFLLKFNGREKRSKGEDYGKR